MADGELEARFRSQERQRSEQAILRSWREAGHTPYRHLTGLRGSGDRGVLNELYRRETTGARNLSSWLAREEICELGWPLIGGK